MEQLQAAALLRALGLPDGPLEKAYSNSNAVWMSHTHIVRGHIIGPAGRLEHEAAVARRLPAEALYPTVVEAGWDGEHDWMVQERVTGQPLSAAWPALSESERRLAIAQLGTALCSIYVTDATGLSPLCQFGGAPVIPRREIVRHAIRVFQSECRDRAVADAASDLVNSLGHVIDDDPNTIIHGDLNPNNVIWDGKVTGLIDLEMARCEAPDVDLLNFLLFCANPVRAVAEELELSTRAEDYRDAPQWLLDSCPNFFQQPLLQHRLKLYELIAVATELQHEFSGARRQAETWLANIVNGRSVVTALGFT